MEGRLSNGIFKVNLYSIVDIRKTSLCKSDSRIRRSSFKQIIFYIFNKYWNHLLRLLVKIIKLKQLVVFIFKKNTFNAPFTGLT